ncbi:excalibur calcium-binding domain-containing protein [Streptomyces sp. NPDC050504]|uniref:excalibur calcium-binding domain-containing protein n=1 Tax=Streptomyces sp. NPDC050504 TaxID=3365618 RepID=UPI00378DB120
MIIALLVLFAPAGILLAWLSRWTARTKIIATVLSGLWFLLVVLQDPPKKKEDDATPRPAVSPGATVPAQSSPSPSRTPNYVGQNLEQAKAAAYADGYNAVSHDASDGNAGQWDDDNWKVCFQSAAAKRVGTLPTLDFGVVRTGIPCPAKDGGPIPFRKMPQTVGQPFVKAIVTLKPLRLQKTEPQSAYIDVTLPDAVDDWIVCSQEPEEGEELRSPGITTAYLKLVAPGTACPKPGHIRLHPEPNVPDASHEPDPSRSGGSDPDGSSSSGGSDGGSAYYRNCAEARDAHAAPLHLGEPGYRPGLDADGDGTACDR